MYKLRQFLRLPADEDYKEVTLKAIDRIAALEAELKQAKDSLARVTKERDEILAMLREVTFRGNFAPNDYELELRACEMIRMLEPDKKGGGA